MRSVGPNPCCPNLGRALGLAISAASSKFVNQLPLGCSALAKGGGAGEHVEQEEGRLLHKMAGMANTLGLGLFRTGGDCPLTSELLTSHLDCDLWIQFPIQERALGWVKPGWPEETKREHHLQGPGEGRMEPKGHGLHLYLLTALLAQERSCPRWPGRSTRSRCEHYKGAEKYVLIARAVPQQVGQWPLTTVSALLLEELGKVQVTIWQSSMGRVPTRLNWLNQVLCEGSSSPELWYLVYCLGINEDWMTTWYFVC